MEPHAGRRLEMTESLGEYLTSSGVGTDTILQAARFCLAERTDDLPIEEMRRQIIDAVGDEARVDALTRRLEQDPLVLENAALALLSTVWHEPGGSEWVTSAVEDADKSLPVLEVGMLTMAMMYIAYLAITGGVKEEEEVEERQSDGTLKRTTKRKFFGPTGPLSQIVELFRVGGGERGEDGT
jgi:hypothetical protein